MNIPDTMLAAVLTGYGGPEKIVLETRPVPQPRDDEILVKVAATSVNSGDVRIRTLDLPKGFGLLGRLALGITRPRVKVLGAEFSGTVVATGSKVTRFSVGDEVMGMPGLGTHQQYRAVGQGKAVVAKPASLSFQQAAALSFGGSTALHFLRKAGVQRGERLLVIGGTGTVGSALIQIGRHFGAEVTAATSAGNMELAKCLGAHTVIDYRQTDYTSARAAYDIIADTVGATSFNDCFDALEPGGRFLAIAGGLFDLFYRGRSGKRQIAGMAGERQADIEYLADLAREGAYLPQIDTTFPLAEIGKAHARAGSGHKRGSVVVVMD